MEKIKPDIIRDLSGDISEELVKDEVLKVARACFQCGTCAGGCPSGRRTALRTRQVIRKALLNMEDVLKDDDIWLCSTCYTCYERCPRSVPVTDVIIKLRNLASKKGYMKDAHRGLTHILINTGHGVPLDGKIQAGKPFENGWTKLRESYGLDPIPPTTHSSAEAVEEVKKLIESTEFDKLVGYPPKPK
jgi:heterodisulfide reductase subunit C